MTDILFEGRTRAETKRKALAWWIDHQDELSISLREFLAGCTTSEDGLHITWRSAQAETGEKRLRDRAAKLVRAFLF